MKVAFVLDPSVNQNLLKRNLVECFGAICSFYNILENYDSLLDIQPDLIFLSPELNQINPIGFLKQLEEISFDLVIVSSNDRYALRAFQYGALHYIITPVSLNSIKQVKQRMSKLIAISSS